MVCNHKTREVNLMIYISSKVWLYKEMQRRVQGCFFCIRSAHDAVSLRFSIHAS